MTRQSAADPLRGCSRFGVVPTSAQRRLCRPCDCADLRCESVVLQGVRPRQVGTITTRRQGSAGFRSRVAGWTWIGATERGEGRRDSNSPVYTPKQPATRSVATLVLGRGAGSASLARRWQTSGRATGLCRPTGGGSLNPQAIQPQGRHNQKVGTIGDHRDPRGHRAWSRPSLVRRQLYARYPSICTDDNYGMSTPGAERIGMICVAR